MYLTQHHNDNRTASDDEISRYLLIERTSLCHADLGLVFGNRHCHEKLADQAADLYHQGYFPNIIVSGGRPDAQGRTEAGIIRARLADLDVPEDRILPERQSRNTPENVQYSRMAYGMMHGSEPPIKRNIVCIGSAVAGRRFLMSMASYWPEAFAMAANVNPFDFPLEEWPHHADARTIVRKEFAKAVSYKAKGDIKEINVDDINRVAELKESRYNQLLPKGL